MTKRSALIKDDQYWDVRLSWASAMFFLASAINAAIKNIAHVSSHIGSLLSILAGLVILGSYLLCWKVLQRRNAKLFWRSVLLFVIIYSVSAILIYIHGDPLDLMIRGTAFLTFAWWIPTGVLACSVKDKNVLYNTWVKASYAISAAALIIFFFHTQPEDFTGAMQYNMVFGYTIILPLLIQFNEFLRTKKKWLLLLVLFETTTIFIFASRGVLLSLFFFVIYKFALESNSIVKRIGASLLLVFVVVVLSSSIQTIAESLQSILSTFDIESRTLETLATGAISDTSERDTIWKICFKMIEDRPFFGWGLGGEYYHISQQMTGTIEGLTADAWHPHNGIIQNFVCFGLLGGFISTLLCVRPLFHLKKTHSRATHDLLVVFASSSVVPICVASANFFTNPAVAVYIYLFYFENSCLKSSSVRNLTA